MMKLIQKLLDNKSGSISVETALVIPILLTCGLGAVDVSNYLLQNHKMETGLVSAGRYLAFAQDPQSMNTRAKRLAVSGRIDAGASPAFDHWTIDDVAITYNSTENSDGLYRGNNEILTVKITSQIPYKGLGILNAVTGGSTLSASYEERILWGGS